MNACGLALFRFVLPNSSTFLKLDNLVHHPALRASRTVNVRIVRVNKGAFSTAKNVVLAGRRFKPLSAAFRIDRYHKDSDQQSHEINEQQCFRREFHYSTGSFFVDSSSYPH